MAIKMGSDGTLYCNTVKRKWKQCLNMISINDYRWTGQGATYGTSTGGIAISDGGYIIAQVPVILASLSRTYYFAIKTSTSTSGAYVSAIIYNLAVGENPIGAMSLSSDAQTLKGWASMRGYGIASHISDNSNARIKIYSHGGTVTIEKIILVDLTDGFGLGDEPSLTWCDNNIKERFTLPVRGTSDRFDLNTSPFFTGSGFASFSVVPRDIGSVSTGAVFREYPLGIYYSIMSDYTKAEGYLYYTNSVSIPSASTDKHYYYNYYYRIERGKFSTELYWPETDPPLPECSLIPGYAYNAGGSMQAWHKASGYGDRSMFAGQSGTPRIDFNNDYTSTQLYISDVQIAPAEDIIYRYNQEFGTSIAVSDINKEFCDCWVESAKGSIIHIYNPLTKQIAFGANKKVNRSDTAYTRAQLEALKNVHNSSWSTTGYSNSDLKRGDVCYIDCTISDENNKKARFFVVINSVIVTSNSSSILTDNLNYYTEDEEGYNLQTDILCNDIIIDPTVNKITFNKENGTIICKKLVKTQTY